MLALWIVTIKNLPKFLALFFGQSGQFLEDFRLQPGGEGILGEPQLE
jgi:hypothetical protein